MYFSSKTRKTQNFDQNFSWKKILLLSRRTYFHCKAMKGPNFLRFNQDSDKPTNCKKRQLSAQKSRSFIFAENAAFIRHFKFVPPTQSTEGKTAFTAIMSTIDSTTNRKKKQENWLERSRRTKNRKKKQKIRDFYGKLAEVLLSSNLIARYSIERASNDNWKNIGISKFVYREKKNRLCPLKNLKSAFSLITGQKKLGGKNSGVRWTVNPHDADPTITKIWSIGEEIFTLYENTKSFRRVPKRRPSLAHLKSLAASVAVLRTFNRL